MRSFSRFLLLGLMFFPALLQADDQAAASNESKLRDALRNTMLQLQDAQNQMATAQASQAQSDKDNADLKAQIETLKSQMNQQSQQASDDKAAALKAEAALNAQIADQSTEISKLNEALAEWKKAYGQAAQMAALKESERAKMAVVVLMLHRQVDDLETKNLTLFSTANEILTRYEKFSLGEALGAKEPFTGIARVKLEEAVQDYQDKLIDQRLMAPHDPPLPPPLPSGPSAAANVPASSTSTP